MPGARVYRGQRGSARDRIADLLMATKSSLTTPQIIARTGVSRAVASTQLNALERAGWIERRAIPGDGRTVAWAWRREAEGAVA